MLLLLVIESTSHCVYVNKSKMVNCSTVCTVGKTTKRKNKQDRLVRLHMKTSLP